MHLSLHAQAGCGAGITWSVSAQARLYEFIVRSFLATCSKPAVGFETRVEVDIAEELFDARGALLAT